MFRPVPGSLWITGDGALAVTCSADSVVEARRLDGTGEPRTLGESRLVHALAVAARGTRVAIVQGRGAVQVVDAASGAAVAGLATDADVRAVALSADGTKAATGAADGTVRIWDVATGDEIVTARGHGAAIAALEFSPDGTQLVSASDDATARLWPVDPLAAARARLPFEQTAEEV